MTGRLTKAANLRAGRCQCPVCGELFTSVREFDRHRIGTFEQIGGRGHDRRCLTAEDLASRGWRKDARGFWMQGRPRRAPAEAEGARQRKVHSPASQDFAGRQKSAGA